MGEVPVFHVPRLQAPPESPILRRPAVRLPELGRMPPPPNLAVVRHGQSGRRPSGGVDSPGHGCRLQDRRLHLPSLEDQQEHSVNDKELECTLQPAVDFGSTNFDGRCQLGLNKQHPFFKMLWVPVQCNP